jgi:outer membrane lipoprotein
MSLLRLVALACALLLTACAAPRPLVDRTLVTARVTPEEVTIETLSDGQVVNWGGQVIELRSRDEGTEIEVLSYPVRNSGRPDDLADSDGRFIALKRGEVDPLLFAPGRMVTVIGTLTRIEQGNIGDRSLSIPVIEVIELSRVPERRDTVQPYFSIGVGIGL